MLFAFLYIWLMFQSPQLKEIFLIFFRVAIQIHFVFGR